MENNTERTYAAGFEAGQRLAKYSPDVTSAIRDSITGHDDFTTGIADGIVHYEQLLERSNNRQSELQELDESRDQEQNYENDIE